MVGLTKVMCVLVMLFRILMLLHCIPSASNVMNLKVGGKMTLNSKADLGWCQSRWVGNFCMLQAIEMKGETVQDDCLFIYPNFLSQELFGWILKIICYFEPFSNGTGKVRVIWQEIVISQTGPRTVMDLKRFEGDGGGASVNRESQSKTESGITRCSTENNSVKHTVTLAARTLSINRYCAAIVSFNFAKLTVWCNAKYTPWWGDARVVENSINLEYFISTSRKHTCSAFAFSQTKVS